MNSLVLDIGCDHALLDIYLVKERNLKKAIASDIGKGPLECAFENIKKYHVEEKIELRLGDGLSTYTDDIDTVVISGMGGRTMIGIFKNRLSITKRIKEVIVSPNNYQKEVRNFFRKNGFYIKDEYLVKEGKMIYQIMKFTRGKKKYTKKDDFFGPVLLAKKDKLFKEYYQKELRSREILVNLLPKNYRLKRFRLKREIEMIQKELT